ncbi:UbiA prenyltransferase family [Astrocystis sublimbata]|nr:UbiA prenyltransferase family [Astrocystis sublimbata]
MTSVKHGAVLLRAPIVLFWVLINLMPFAINNQASPLSIAEDSINKPWRPLPSGRLSRPQAHILMVVFYAVAQFFSSLSGGLRQSLCLVFLGMWYNRFGGADDEPVIRSGINALGYICFLSGAMEVALDVTLALYHSFYLLSWLGIIAAIIFTTVHSQDFSDQEGDALRGRRTLPLVLGDSPSRWVLAIWMSIWGIVCPSFWGAALPTRILGLALAECVGLRSIMYRNSVRDKTTFFIWNVWICFVYMLPLMV